MEQEEVILTEPESEEADENFYMNRLLMVGTEGRLPSSPHRNPESSYYNVISPQIEVLPKRGSKRILENLQDDESVLIYSARGDAVNKDGDNSTNVDHTTDTETPRTKSQKRRGTCTKNVKIGQNTRPLKWLLRSSCKSYPQKSQGNQQRGKSKAKFTKETSKERQNRKDASSKKSEPTKSVVIPHSSRRGQQSPGEKLSRSPAIKKTQTGKVLSINSIHKRNRFGETLLHTAAVKGDVQSVKDMIKVGTCVNLTDNAGWTPLHEAVLHHHYTIVETLLKAGAQVDPAGYHRVTPLQDAVLLGDLEITELLLKHGADPLLKNDNGEAAIDINKDLNVQNLLRKFIPTAQTTCWSDQSMSIAKSSVESGIEDTGRRHCTEARQSAEKDEATTNQQTSKTEASVGPHAGDAENVHDSSINREGSPKVSSAQTVLPLQEGQAKNVVIAGSILAHDGCLRIQDPERLIPDTPSSIASDSESDVTVDYIETHTSSPGHWFLSATQDFSGSLHRLVGEIARRDANSLDEDPHASQLNQNDIPDAIIYEKEQYIVDHGLHRAPDEQGTGEQRENPADPLDTGTSVSILRDLAQRPLCLLPTPDNNQESSDCVKEHNLQIAVENEEVSFTDKLISQRQKKTEISTTEVRKKSSKFKLETMNTNSVDAGTKQPLKNIQKMNHHKNCIGETSVNSLPQARKKGNLPLAKTSMNTGMNNIPDNACCQEWAPLHKATSAAGHVDVVEHLLHAGADVKRPGPDGVTPAHSSVFCGHNEVVKLLFQHDTNPHDKQGSDCLPHKHKMQENTSGHKKDSSRSNVFCEERFLPLTLQEVEEKQNEMSAWRLNEPEDRDRFTVTLLETQTVLNNVFFKQHVEKIHLSKECRTTPDSFHDGKLNQSLLDFTSRQKYLLMLLQKQNELKHKLKMSTDQQCSSSTTSTEISARDDPQHSLPFIDHNEENNTLCEPNYSTSSHSHLESQSVIPNIAFPSLLSGRPVTTDDSRILRGLIRTGVIQPGENTLGVPLMASSQESSLTSLKHTRGKTFSAAEHKVTKHKSKTPKDCSLTADSCSENEPPQQLHASGLTCTGSSAQGLSAKETIKSIRSIHLIRDEEFLPCYVMDRYWNSFIQSEDWDF